MASEANQASAPQSVRFSSQNEEIEPEVLETYPNLGAPIRETLSPETEKELRSISVAMQQNRMHAIGYEPVSLPASRVSPSSAFKYGKIRRSGIGGSISHWDMLELLAHV
jgi:uncharacterized Zn finger protein